MTTESDTHIGVYVCLTKACTQRNVEVKHPWMGDWPLAQRQHKCTKCKKRMLLFAVRKVMTPEAKAKLAAFVAQRKQEREEVRRGGS
jgi:hypothetical protein